MTVFLSCFTCIAAATLRHYFNFFRRFNLKGPVSRFWLQAKQAPVRVQAVYSGTRVPRRLRGQRERLREIMKLPTLIVSLVLYKFWRHARLQIDSTGLPTLNVYIVFYMLWKHARLHMDSIGLPILDVSIVCYWLWSHARFQLDFIGLHYLSVSIMSHIHCSSNIKVLIPPVLALQFEGLHPIFLVTSQAGPSPRTFRVLRDSKPVPRLFRGHGLTLLDCPHWMFLLYFTRRGSKPGYSLTPLCPH